jgi:hypothetical protein
VIRRRRAAPDWASPAFRAQDVPDAVWARRSELHGITLDLDAQTALLAELAPLGAELAATGYEFANNFYEHVDAETAYAMVRRLRPSLVVELGSGFSTLALRAALGEGEYRGFDPYSRHDFVEKVPAQEVPGEVFARLGRDDVLFVDTTHVVRTGGDVNRIVLDVLPVLAPGVVVHFHDIWLPYEYHRDLVAVLGANWSEQYLLQAFLSGNRGWEVLLANAALARERRDAVRAAFPDWEPDREFPTAFWLRKTA